MMRKFILQLSFSLLLVILFVLLCSNVLLLHGLIEVRNCPKLHSYPDVFVRDVQDRISLAKRKSGRMHRHWLFLLLWLIFTGCLFLFIENQLLPTFFTMATVFMGFQNYISVFFDDDPHFEFVIIVKFWRGLFLLLFCLLMDDWWGGRLIKYQNFVLWRPTMIRFFFLHSWLNPLIEYKSLIMIWKPDTSTLDINFPHKYPDEI